VTNQVVPTPVETIHLLTLVGYTDEDAAAASRSKVVEQLLRLSYSDVQRYQSDCFHDAAGWQNTSTPFRSGSSIDGTNMGHGSRMTPGSAVSTHPAFEPTSVRSE